MAVEYGWFSLVLGRINPLLEGSRAQTDQGVWTNERAAVLQFLCGSARSINPQGVDLLPKDQSIIPVVSSRLCEGVELLCIISL